jgi:thymidylate synthase
MELTTLVLYQKAKKLEIQLITIKTNLGKSFTLIVGIIMKSIKTKFKDADSAFKYFKKKIRKHGEEFDGTKALFNVGFYIDKPKKNIIRDKERNWSLSYAEAEWQWYLTGDNSIKTLGALYGRIPQIWKKMADENGLVNSNYGWQWIRSGQLHKVISLLRTNPKTRKAAISIYDAKEFDSYKTDTPCTYAVQFTVRDGLLNMSVLMRSNDLWYGFCNDQYCFSELQKMVARQVGLEVGHYYHYAHNLHLYSDKL